MIERLPTERQIQLWINTPVVNAVKVHLSIACNKGANYYIQPILRSHVHIYTTGSFSLFVNKATNTNNRKHDARNFSFM